VGVVSGCVNGICGKREEVTEMLSPYRRWKRVREMWGETGGYLCE
jgi:hypothetical protein